MTAPLLSVRGLVIEFDTAQGRRRVVDGISFELGEGEVLGILGESGSGKTVSTLAVMGLVEGNPGVVGGEVTLRNGAESLALFEGLEGVIKRRAGKPDRKNVRRWQRMVSRRMRPLWGEMMTAVFQNPRHSLDPLLTIGVQVEESIALAERSLDRAGRRARAVEWLDRVQMSDPERVYRSYAHELSGGMCQRAMIAVALARAPRILVADEPTTGLDTTVRAEIVGLFEDLLADRRRSMLYISHDIREVLHLSDRVIVMRHGRIVEEATAEDLRAGRGERDPYTASLLAAAELGEAL
ncbi:MAG: ABC transporter ATP-binding protein [Myxococcales bacterium]|nr:ABC transporter ATP-binding protein [Myxococcales bacterium]MCB9549109.1 ABC transporter ATP-binding protein [Myxococcales bacterium]